MKNYLKYVINKFNNKSYMTYNKENCTLELHTKDDVQVFGLENEDKTRNIREFERDIILNAFVCLKFNS